LTSRAFEFELDNELRRAVRSRNHVTLVLVNAVGSDDGPADETVSADSSRASDVRPIVSRVAQIIGKEVRDTDFLGETDEGALALLLLDANLEHSSRVIDRLLSRIERSDACTSPLTVGAACYPTDAVDAGTLKRHAMSRPVAAWPGRPATART
jgi:hypothetical protein